MSVGYRDSDARVVSNIEEIKRQLIDLAHHAPHIARRVGTVRVPVAEHYYPAIDHPEGMLAEAARSVFVLCVIADLSAPGSVAVRIDLIVEQRLHGQVVAVYPESLWHRLVYVGGRSSYEATYIHTATAR